VVGVLPDGTVLEQAAGCGGFGTNNVRRLAEAVEAYERTLKC
jgi:hypothetical protein